MDINNYSNGQADRGELFSGAKSVIDAFEDLLALTPNQALPKAASEPARFMRDRYKALDDEIDDEHADLEKLVEEAGRIAVCGIAIVNVLSSNAHADIPAPARMRLLNASNELKAYTEGHSVVLAPMTPAESGPEANSEKKELTPPTAKTFVRAEDFKRRLGEMEAQLTGLDGAATRLRGRIEQIVSEERDIARTTLEAKMREVDQLLADFSTNAKSEISGLQSIRNDASAIAGDLAISQLAKGYAGNANDEQVVADQFRKISLVLMVCLTLFLVTGLSQLAVDKIHWQDALIRLAMSFVATVPIGYTARESAKHRAQAVDLRKTALDFAALAPYLETIPEPDKSKLKAEIARRVFFSDAKADTSSSLTLDPQQLIIKALDIANEAVKKK